MGLGVGISFRGLRFAAAVVLALLASAACAAAFAAPERVDYVRQLESVCRPGVERTQAAVAGERADVRAERFGLAAGKLAHAERIFGTTVRTISTVPRPPADAAQLAKWFADLRHQEHYLRRAAAALRSERIVSYQHNAVLFVHNGNLANDVVLAYGFNYCRFKFSRFER
jgi:hypothetical protein